MNKVKKYMDMSEGKSETDIPVNIGICIGIAAGTVQGLDCALEYAQVLPQASLQAGTGTEKKESHDIGCIAERDVANPLSQEIGMVCKKFL